MSVDESGIESRFRYLAGEARALQNFGTDREEEIVALGFLMRNGDVRWHALTNIAEEPAHRFFIDGFEVQEAIRTVGDFGTPHVLWHSHSADCTPSNTDVESFPTWLVGIGVVFATSTGKSCIYNEDGVIISTSTSATPALATQEI